MASLRFERRPSLACWAALALAGLAFAGLAFAGLALALGHTALAPAVDHADCLLCHSLNHLLLVAAVSGGGLLVATALCTPRLYPESSTRRLSVSGCILGGSEVFCTALEFKGSCARFRAGPKGR